MQQNITQKQAVASVREKTETSGGEYVALSDALGRVLAFDLLAPMDQPPFFQSFIEGYALRAMDVLGASGKKPVRLTVVDDSLPGASLCEGIESGQAVRVFPGSALPPGADCVIGREEVQEENGGIIVSRSLRALENCPAPGSLSRTGQVLLPAGTVIDGSAVARISGAGLTRIIAKRLPRVFLISIGDHLRHPNLHPLPEGKLFDSSGPMLQAKLKSLGITCEYVRVADDAGTLSEVSFIAAEKYDLVITTGGLLRDMDGNLPNMLERCNARHVFYGVDGLGEGKVLFSTLYRKPFLCFSGDPTVAEEQFDLLFMAMLEEMTK